MDKVKIINTHKLTLEIKSESGFQDIVPINLIGVSERVKKLLDKDVKLTISEENEVDAEIWKIVESYLENYRSIIDKDEMFIKYYFAEESVTLN